MWGGTSQKQQSLVARQFRRALVLSGLFVLFLLVLVAALGARGGFSIDVTDGDAGVHRHALNEPVDAAARRSPTSAGERSYGVPSRRLSAAPDWQAPLDAGVVLHVGGVPDDADSAGNHLPSDAAAAPLSHPVLSFSMSGGMSTAWKSSSKRLSFPTRVSVRSPGSSLSAAGETVRASATFYGKSSLKLKYTRRRSLHVHFERPTRVASDGPAMSDVLLLSLWEDRYRLAYRSSAELLRQLGLFHSYARLVELRCDALLDTAGDDENVCRGGVTLGAYLLLEYPSSAIERFAAVETKSPRQRVCESDAEFAVRRDWMTIPAESLRVEVATRNWFYFEKPKKYDMLHVPSYTRNSSLSKPYARIEQDPQRFSFSTAATANRGLQASERFDLNLYLTWIAVNSVLMNGDYDDEVFFFQVAHQHHPSPRQSISIMAWDYDTVFAPCHRKIPSGLSRLMYCAETPIEKHIVAQPTLSRQYQQVLRCVLERVATEARWRGIVTGIALAELQNILGSSPAAARATFDDTPAHPPDVRRGAEDLSSRFADRRRELESALPADGVAMVDAQDDSGPHSREPAGEIAARPASPSSVVVVRDSSGLCDIAALRRNLASHLKKGLPREHKGGRGHVNVAALPSTVSAVTVLLPADVAAANHVAGGRADGNTTAVFTTVILSRQSRPTAALVRSGLYCARIAFHGCRDDATTDYAFVLRDKERGAAEFAVEPFQKPPPTAMIHDGEGGPVLPREITVRLRLFVPWQWVHERWIPIIVLTTAGATGDAAAGSLWLRDNQRITIDGGQQREQHSMLIRGYSALRLVTGDVRHNDGDITEDVHGPLAWWSGETAANGVTARVVTVRLGGSSENDGDGASRSPRQATARFPAPRSLADVELFQSIDTVRSVMGSDCVVMLDGVTTIRRGGAFTVGAGCLVVLREGAVWTVEGELRLEGTATHPITLTSLGEDQQWVSLVVQGPHAKLMMSHTFVTGSGVKGKLEPGTGRHHKHSAAVTVVGGAHAEVSHAYLLNLQGPAFAAGSGGHLDVRFTVVQWAELGVECVDCTFTSVASMWTNFPSWDRSYEDNDNDAMYLSGGIHRVEGSVIAHTKDDGIDSGTPEKGPSSTDGGSLHVSNCIFEGIQHEAVALSSAPRAARLAKVENCWIRHAQQGVESGYTGRRHEAKVSGVVIENTFVGLRYGDNYYNRPQQGHMTVENVTLFDNEVNALNYVRETGEAQQAAHFRINRETSRFYPDRRQQRIQASGVASGMCAALYSAGAANVNERFASARPSTEELARSQGAFALVPFSLEL